MAFLHPGSPEGLPEFLTLVPVGQDPPAPPSSVFHLSHLYLCPPWPISYLSVKSLPCSVLMLSQRGGGISGSLVSSGALPSM